MRLLRTRIRAAGRAGRRSLAAGCFAILAATPAVAVPLVFPTSRAIVPVVVVGAFILPALLALLWFVLAQPGRLRSAFVAMCVLAITAIAAIAWQRPAVLVSIWG